MRNCWSDGTLLRFRLQCTGALALVLTVAIGLSACKEKSDAPLPVRQDAASRRSLGDAPLTSSIEPTVPTAFGDIRVMSFDEFEARVLKIPGVPEHYIVNGDMQIVGKRNLARFFKAAKDEANGVVGGKLLVDRIGDLSGGPLSGMPNIWEPEIRRNLTFCVSTDLEGHHGAVVQAMEVASRNWERYVDIDFIHLPTRDAACSPEHEDIVFAVALGDLGPFTLASAPFPDDQKRFRVLRLGEIYLASDQRDQYPLDELLLHELGHILGFDHEFNRPDAGSCFQPDDNFAVTDPDRKSVMMYPNCIKLGEWDGFKLSELDKQGAACLYGAGPEGQSDGECRLRAAHGSATGRQIAARWDDQLVNDRHWKYFEALKVKPGSIVNISLRPSPGQTGDADLYVRFIDRPSSREADCSPLISHGGETCRLFVPKRTGENSFEKVYIGVHGVGEATFSIEAIYIAPDAS
ncbi:MAG: hypothetical protein JNM58_03380 [Xanthomonadaceae bacterium]|nr:hypothetical protein [Xanthomonadaceae bacterium]